MRILLIASIILFTNCAIAAKAEESEIMSGLVIKELLNLDFGYEVDIAGGSGKSLSDPIFVNSTTHAEATSTEMLVLMGMARGRNVYWRTLETIVTDSPNGKIVQRKIETKKIEEKEIISRTENYYFSRVNAPRSENNLILSHIVHTDPQVNISFPYEISWLHFDEYVDYDSSDPGLGYSLGYYAPDIKAHIYVYPVNDRHPSHKVELEAAIEDVKVSYGAEVILRHWGIIEDEDHSHFSFVPRHEPDQNSSIFVFSSNAHFIKVRITFIDGRENREFAQSFITDFINNIPRDIFPAP